ncbi:glycosyltransferase family 4 protein [Moritella sp. 28]|uniref:glycosyltransferase family 4 protein n=1 Tax=Moritella sp. 28 TaxID=2746232 RepID=UPI001BABE62A|nr:glycosyltransferase family 4 protein [Moritella sp. 28]QUM83592.1 glycosyltransferase family 4 protein [Moritella sp. 28]
MIKVLIVSPDILPVPAVRGGAVETLIQQLVESSLQANNRYVSYTVMSVEDELLKDKSNENINGRYIYAKHGYLRKKISGVGGRFLKFFGISRSFANLYVMEVSKLLAKSDFDYVIVENQPEYALALRNKTKAKIVLHLHNDKLNAATPFSKEIVSSVDYIFTVSKYIKGRVESIPSVKSQCVKVLYNCVDISKFSKQLSSEQNRNIRSQYSINENARIILFVGRLDKTKGVLELVKAFNRIQASNIVLLIAGSAWFSDNRKSQFMSNLEVEANKSKNSVVFTGYVDHKNIPNLQQLSDVLVVPSVWDDPCPLVVLESMVSGRPLVATDSGGVPELVPNDCGLLASRMGGGEALINGLATAIEGLLSNSEKGKLLAKNALGHVQWFDVNDYSNRFEQLLKEIESEK